MKCQNDLIFLQPTFTKKFFSDNLTLSLLRGFGFVTFSADDEAEKCIQAKSEGHTVNGKSVEVKRAIPRDADPDQREKNTKMFVGGLSLNSTEDSIREFFEKTFNCSVESVDLIYQKKDQLEPGQEPRPR